VGLLNPNRLLWAISIAILLAIYLRSRSRPTLEVSSLLLFDEAAAPSARVKHLRIDPLFWLELAVLGALTLALAGLYVRTVRAATRGRDRALVFDLAAGMGAREGAGTRLDAAKKEALAIVDGAPERDRFSLIGYALEAELIHPETANRDAIHQAISRLRPLAVPGRRAAQSAALMRARAAGEVEFFADRRPPASIITDSGLSSGFHFHQSGAPADNLALVSLDPGIPNSSRGRAVLKNFGPRPGTCELAIDNGGKAVFHQTLVLAPREQIMVPFGPLAAGGLVHAQILSRDALDADNDRYAYGAVDSPSHVLVLSPDAAVRDDIARVLLAVNSNFIIATADPANFKGAEQYSLVVMHDCYVAGIKAQSVLLVFPPASASDKVPGLRIIGTSPAALMTNQGRADANAAPTALASTRTVAVPEWMKVRASGAAAGAHETAPLAAIGSLPSGQFGLIAFDVRRHLLLDPDRLDALVAMVDLARELTAPTQLRIVSTGAFLAVPAAADAKVMAPDGSAIPASRDKWGRLRIRPLQPGHYSVESATEKIDVYANYYDASESDLTASAAPASPIRMKSASEATSGSAPKQVQPLSALLIVVAVIAILLESALLLRNANRGGMRHV
jgi:von Willebrand factor type A domain